VLNLAYDWLPLYLVPFLPVPVAHLISMGSLNHAMDDAVAALAVTRPGALGAHTHAQAETFPVPAGAFRVVGGGIDVDRYRFQPVADAHLGWVGRISPEKGLDDVFALSARTGVEVRVWGLMEHEQVWTDAVAAHPDAKVTYRGFLPTDQLQAELGRCRGLLMTPRWVEAFGNVAIEAMACGVPVIAYRRGGPAEIVRDGLEGFVVPPDDIDALAAAVSRVGEIERAACRARVEAEYSIDAFAQRIDTWFDALCADRARR
jgi:UDP-glucose:tetrahydrobiopterin glucosyltransferase